MDHRITLRRGQALLSRELRRLQLDMRKRRTRGDFFVDYGWIRLLYSGDADNQELYYHLNQAQWHDTDMVTFRGLLMPGQTAIDVGANMGFVTTMLAAIVGHDGRVLSFEPSPVVFEKLVKTIKANGLSQVTPLNFGCGAAPSVERLNMVSDSSGNASIVGEARQSIEIRVERLDDVREVWTNPVSLLKIDTEGYEPEVLQGAQRLIEEQKPIVYLELGGDYVASTLRSIELLTEAGYSTEHVRSIDWSAVGNGSDYTFFPRR